MSCRIDRRGFTLVEMLVVIAIISVLVAISVPTMSKLGMFGRDPLNVAARQTLVMLKAARIYAGTHNVDTAVVYAIGLHKGPQSATGTVENIRVIDGIAMVRRITSREKEIFENGLTSMVNTGQITQSDADNRHALAFAGSEGADSDRYLPFVPVKGTDGVFTPLQRGAVLAWRNDVTGHIYGDDADIGTPDDINVWGDEEWGLLPIRLVDGQFNPISPRVVKGSNPKAYYEYMPLGYGNLDQRFPAHVFKPSGVLETSASEKARFVVTVIPDPEAPQDARFLEDGRPVPAEELEIYSTIGRIQSVS